MPTPLPTLTFLLATATALPVTALPATPPAVATLPVVDQAPARSAVPIPPDHLTRAELTGFRSTSSYDETLTFLRRLEKTSPSLKLDFYGKTAEGRPMPLVIVSKEKAFRPAAPGLSRKPVVLILNGIHAGEVDGKDACLMILRDLALGNRPEILEALTLLVVPIYNVDGHERVSPFNRPNQDGPVDGMGFRTTTQGLDLNRDFLKADAPETRALLSLSSAWQVDLFVDDHVTDGSDLQATLTTAWGSEVATPAPILAWMKRVVPAALAGVEAAGYKTAPYVEWADPTDPSKGIDLGPSAPRYSTGYFPLRQVPSILVETHSIKPYHQRVRANERFLLELLAETGRQSRSLLEARDESRVSERAAPQGQTVVLGSETDFTRPEMVDFPGFEWRSERSPISGRLVVRYDPSKPVTTKLPVFSHALPTATATRPAAYVVPAGWPAVEERLAAHGIPFRKLERTVVAEVETFRAKDPTFSAAPWQGRIRVQAAISSRKEKRTLPAGSLYVPLDHTLATLAMHLLEPSAPDSLFQWGAFSTIFEQKEYIDSRVLDPIAEEMLARDPLLRRSWEEKLKDPAFASSREKRVRFFYERTPYWDETLGLVPVYRLAAPLSAASASASGPG
jgi:hypothetical protein